METTRVATPDIVRLWVIGGANNIVRWVELLAAALFTLEATGSGFAVAAVSAARTLPLLLFGALAGVLAEAMDRKRVLFLGMVLTALASLAVFLLAAYGIARPWHIALAAFVSGLSWAADMSTRRRMVGEAAPPGLIPRVIALDSLAGAVTRMAGPILGGGAFAALGLAGVFASTTAVTLAELLLVPPIRNVQPTQRLSLARLAGDLADGMAWARRDAAICSVLGVTVAMNFFAFAYVAVVAPLGLLVFQAPVAMVGALASAEPFGSLIGGIVLAAWTPLGPRALFLGGSALFLTMLLLMPLMPAFGLACALLAIGGLGTAAFGNVQTTLVLSAAPPAVRSRLMGLITVGMGCGPLGQVLIGVLSDRVGPVAAVELMAFAGAASLAALTAGWLRSGERQA
jgi:MFS family permease